MDEQSYVESRFGILDHVPVGVFVLRNDYTILFWNRCLEQWTKLLRHEVVGKSFDACFSTLQKPLLRVRLETIFEGGPPAIFSSQLHSYLIPVATRTGKLRFQHTIVSAVRAEDGNGFYALFAVQDVTDLTNRIQDYLRMREQAAVELDERVKVEEKLRQQKQLLDGVLESLTARIAVLDHNGAILDCNRAWTLFTREHAASEMEIQGNYLEAVKSIVEDQTLAELMRQGLAAVLEGRLGHYQEEYSYLSKGAENWDIMTVTPLVNGQGGAVVSHIDITARKQAEQKIEHLALHDSLTGLPNRLLFADRCTQAFARSRRYGKLAGLLYIDLDDFKTINDNYGHLAGDLVLQTVARRLNGCVRESDTIARLGGDEFAVLLVDIADADAAARVARKITRGMSRSVRIAGQRVVIRLSIGISVYPTDGPDLVRILTCADAAMYRVKASGKNGFRFFAAPA